MANLLDTIRQNTQTLPEQGVQDQGQALQILLRAKSGKSVGGGPVASSSLGEQQAVVQTNQQIQQQVQPAATIQTMAQQQQAQGMQQQEQLQAAEIAQTRRLDTAQNRVRTDQILKDLEQNKGKIDLARQGAQLEQAATNLRLQNKKYVDQLNREASTARLNDELEFKKAALQASMGDKQQIVNKTIDNSVLLSANDREFKKKVAQIDIGSAYALLNAELTSGKERDKWSGLSGLAKAGIAAYGTYGDTPAETPDTTVKGSQSSAATQNQTSANQTSGDSFIDFIGRNR